ncbi:MAG: trypsin-like peptidase domain-containing protein, partial [Candidatus Hinthialibacter sp.]
MKYGRLSFWSWLAIIGLPSLSFGQGDWAVYDTFVRFSPAVYSISIEIPQQYILERHEELIKQFQDLQENYSDIVAGGSDTLAGQYMFTNVIRQYKRKMEIMRDQMLTNNRVRCAGFAISPHHLVTLSNIVKSATLGGAISIKDDYRWLARAQLHGADDLTGIAVLQVQDVTFSQYVDLEESLEWDEEEAYSTMNRLSARLPTASYIMTIQRPYDLPSSPFSGIIGGYNRLLGLFEIEKYIQTDLPLYPGNEGAPVFSPSGQLVG